MESLPSTFYGKTDKKNAVVSAFDAEIKEFIVYIKRITNSPNVDCQSYAKGSRKLFEIWNKYKSRLHAYYHEKQVLQIADFLFDIKMYRLALWQGYDYYLHRYGPSNTVDFTGVDQFKSTFFPEGFHTEQATLTFRALHGRCMCTFQLEKERESWSGLQRTPQLLHVLALLRIFMQAVLPFESLCWLLYNGSLHIYSICRYLMSTSRPAQALEFLLWACVCLENSIPLLTARYLPWRCTLYCAVCQCYYDLQAGLQAEVFARRALGKVDELAKLEESSQSVLSEETQSSFKETTIKLAAMLFKRLAFEPRRKPKGIFRPKQKNKEKDTHNAPWPHTPSEHLLMELFEGHAAQFLGVIEALRTTTCQPLHSGLPEDPENQEVVLELLSAGTSILSGVGGSTEHVRNENDEVPAALAGVHSSASLLQSAVAGEHWVSVEAAVQLVKQQFQYKQWDTFHTLSTLLIPLLQGLQTHWARSAELDLVLLRAAEPVINTQRSQNLGRDSNTDAGTADKERTQRAMGGVSTDLLALAETLHSCVCTSTQDVQPSRNLAIDLVHFLWSKCRATFQRVQRGNLTSRMQNRSRWVRTLYLLCEVSLSCDMTHWDPVAVAEMSLRLVAEVESGPSSTMQSGSKPATMEFSSHRLTDMTSQTPTSTASKRDMSDQWHKVWKVVERAVENMSTARAGLLPSDRPAASDNRQQQECACTGLQFMGGEELELRDGSTLTFFLTDLYLELLVAQHRLSLKLLHSHSGELQTADIKKSSKQSYNMENHEGTPEETISECALLEKIGKNKISKAIFLIEKALLCHGTEGNPSARKLLQEAAALIEKADGEEKRMARAWTQSETKEGAESRISVPPAPILLSQTQTSMTFAPAPFTLDKQVCWYLLYGREATGANLKVRLGDAQLPGTGEEVPALGECVLRVVGLKPNHRYVFAVAACNDRGQLVGGAIGETTRPLLASLPLPVLTTWAHLAQAAYQIGLHSLVIRACKVLWAHFTHTPLPTPEAPSGSDGAWVMERLGRTRLCLDALQHASALLLPMFLRSIFMLTDMHIQEGALYCDVLSDAGPPIWGQEARLAECEYMLVATDLALWLNDNSAALQAVVGCYRLLAPLIYHRVQSEGAVQVLIKCLAVLQEISAVFRQMSSSDTTQYLLHMVACITYYVTKVLRLSRRYHMATAVLELGRQLLQDIADAGAAPQTTSKSTASGTNWAAVEKVQKKTAHGLMDEQLSKQLRALEASVVMMDQHVHGSLPLSPDLTGVEGSSPLYSMISSAPLKTAYREVMKFKQKTDFLEVAVHLLRRAMQEDALELVLQWGNDLLSFLNRQDEVLTGRTKTSTTDSNIQELKKYTSSIIEYNKAREHKKPKANIVRTDSKRKEVPQTRQLSKPRAPWTDREHQAMDTLLKQLTFLLKQQRRRRYLRQICSEEMPWRAHLNLNLALAHVTLLRRSLEQYHSPTVRHSYGYMDSIFFSLAHVDSLVRWQRGPQWLQAEKVISQPCKKASKVKQVLKEGVQTGEEEECRSVQSEAESVADTARTQMTNDSRGSEQFAVSTLPVSITVSHHLELLSKAAVHFRRAMVLSHRDGHWTSLQWVCRVLWDQAVTITPMVEQRASFAQLSPLTLDQLYGILTPLLVLAADLLMDMMLQLQLYKVFEVKDHELEASLHFSAPVDDGTLVDFRWLKVLILRTLELLYLQGKWETLVHLALIFNSLTRERYTYTITPLVVHAQWRLLDRVSQHGGPTSPQPHFTRTEMVTGERITCRNYMGKQILSGWNSRGTGSPDTELQRALALVSVPLDVEETLCFFREALQQSDCALQSFQHSRKLLLLLLADTQHGVEVPFCSHGLKQSQGRVDFNMVAGFTLTSDPPELYTEDYRTLCSIYSCPLPPSQLQTVISSYNSSIKYLQDSKLNSLSVQALHDLGNLYFYKGNRRAAQSCWSKALDGALQSSAVLSSWDGAVWAGGSPKDVLHQAGVWGVLQGALLSAKIAQYVLTSDISQRTHCCLLSAMLFKTLLTASLSHPRRDWQYASYVPASELIPGLDLFSEPARAHVGGAVASLAFICRWLYSCGHFLTLLPLLSLYLYLVGSVCRDTNRAIGGRILKVQVLTELGLFSAAVTEMDSLVQGLNIPQAHGSFVAVQRQQIKGFDTSKPLLETGNLQALQELVNRDLSSELKLFFGSKMSRKVTVARAQLILGLCSSIHSLPEVQGEDMQETFPQGSMQKHSSGTPGSNVPPVSDTDDRQKAVFGRKSKESHGLQLDSQDKLTPGKLKDMLLGEASHILVSLISTSQSVELDAEELELEVEVRLLMSAVSMQQGRASLSARLAVSTLSLIQDFLLLEEKTLGTSQRPPSSVLGQATAKHVKASPRRPDSEELPQNVEARERLGTLWLRCRLAAVTALAAHLPGVTIHPGGDTCADAARLLEEGLKETEEWKDADTRALLLLQGVLLNTHNGKAKEENASLIQEAVGLLSGSSCLSFRSSLTLASATLQLSNLRHTGSHSLYLLNQRLLQQQLSALGESVSLDEASGILLLPTLGLRNMYLPQLPLLAKTILCLGQHLVLQAANHVTTAHVTVAHTAAEHGQWQDAWQILDSALQVSQASAASDGDLQADILYYRGLVESRLAFLSERQPQDSVHTFLEAIAVAQSHSHNLWFIRRCYLEMALVYLRQWELTCFTEEHSPTCPAMDDNQQQLSQGERHRLHYWTCMRAAAQVCTACTSCTQFSAVTSTTACHLQSSDLQLLPAFVYNDLLSPNGLGVGEPITTFLNPYAESHHIGFDHKHVQLTWVHLLRYQNHLRTLYHIATQPVTLQGVEDLCSLTADTSLAQKLAQLHTFLSVFLPSYRGQCCAPDPPAVLLQCGNFHAGEDQAVEAVEDLSWACAEEQQLCVQWLRPALDQADPNQNMILLHFAFNGVPLSALRPTVRAVSELKCGQLWVPLDRLEAVHTQLCTLCAVENMSPPSHFSAMETSNLKSERVRRVRIPEKYGDSDPPAQEFEEKVRNCLLELRNLLKPSSEPLVLTEVPFLPSQQTLGDLERCFNPKGGAVLSAPEVTFWLASLLL